MCGDPTSVPVLSKHGTESTLSLLGPVPLHLSRLASQTVHTRSQSSSDDTLYINNNKSRLLACHDATVMSAITESPRYVKITFNARHQYGVASALDRTHLIISYLNSAPEKATDQFKSVPLPQEFLQSWYKTCDTSSSKTRNSIKLSMTPPVQDSPVQVLDKEDTINDPFDYFLDKYFSNLYLLTTPLTFFTKSVFARLRSLCMNDSKFYESLLVQFTIPLEDFESRHLASNNGLLNSSMLFEKEVIYRKNFVSKSLNLVDFDIHSTNFQETNRSLKTILNTFRVKEIQIQILTLLELIHATGRDDTSLLKRVSQKKRKRRLVGRKKVTPIINGTAIQVDQDEKSFGPLTYNQLLDLYIDKLAINDLLNGSSSNEQYTPKFINYIVVPFFEKKCPNSVRHMIKKIKGPSFKPPVTKTIAEKKQKMTRPALHRSNSPQMKLTDIDELKPSLSRSGSELESLKRTSSFNSNTLSKREIDMSIPTPSEKLLKKPTSQIFNRVGKRQASTSSLKLTESYSQVEATPVKKGNVVNVMQTPAGVAEATVPCSVGSMVIGSAEQHSIHSSPLVMRASGDLLSPIALRSDKKRPGDLVDFKEPVMESKSVRRRLFASKN